MKILFAGTPEFAAHHLKALLTSAQQEHAKHHIVGVYTQPDRPAGRGKKLTFSPVKELALEHQIPVFQPCNLKSAADQHQLADLQADVMVVVAYGIILPKAVLQAPKFGCINVHGSILPRWRGAAPIQRAIEAGDSESGITIMQMDEGLDTGDMLLKVSCPIHPQDSAADLFNQLAQIGPEALLKTLHAIESGQIEPEKQDDNLSTYAKKIDKAEAEIDWTLSAQIIYRKIRAFYPFPSCFTYLNNERCRILSASLAAQAHSDIPGAIRCDNGMIEVACGQGALIINSLQLAGKKAMHGKDFLNGFSSLLKQQRFGKGQTHPI